MAGGAAVAVGGVAIAVYLVTKRPEDVSNPDAAFHEQKPAIVKTVDWPLYGHDLAAHAVPAGQGPEPAVPLLAVELPGGKAARVPADRGQGQDLLHGQGRDVLRAQHRQGPVQWKRKIGSLNASAPAYADGRLFAVNLEPHQAVALRPNEHGSKVLWRHPLPGRSESSPLVHGGKVIFGCESGDIFALDEKTGKTKWTVQRPAP